MSAEQLLRDGNVADALAALKEQVRNDPASSKHRVFLFQLLAVEGQWDRALNQLNVAAELDPGALAMAQMYRVALQCEPLREQIFSGKRSPVVFGQPPEWIGWLMESLRLTADNEYSAAADLRNKAFDAAPATSGSIVVDSQPAVAAPVNTTISAEQNGKPVAAEAADTAVEGEQKEFEWIADADLRLGPVLEAIVNGRYYWIPFENIRSVAVEKPVDLRDVVWAPAYFTWSNGGEIVGLIPSRYAGSHASDDDLIRLSRKTEWRQPTEDLYLGMGQRMLTTSAGDFSLLDIRRIELNVESPPAAESEDSGEGDDSAEIA